MTDGRRRLAGRYRLEVSLGRGGMSEVFHGYDERLDRRVAIKQLWLVMQLLRGSTLEAVLDRADYTAAPPSPAWAAAIAAQIVALLADVHRAGRADDALAELESVRPLLAVAFGADSTQVRNLDKHIDRLGSLQERNLSRGDDEPGR